MTLPPVTDRHPASAVWARYGFGAIAAALRAVPDSTAAFYLVLVLPVVIVLTSATAPFQTPDETNHFRRAVQILRGDIVGHRISPTDSGGVLPKSVPLAAEMLDPVIGNAAVRVDPAAMRDLRAVRWNWTDRKYTGFVNTVIYPPIFYAPAVAALATGRALGWSVLDSYDAARLTNGIAAVLIGTLALALAGPGRALLLVVLSLPMTLYQFASVSQDGLMIASAGLAIACCSRALGAGRPMNFTERVVAAVLLGGLIAGRPPYVLLCAPLASPLVRLPAGAGLPVARRALAVLPLALALAIGFGWILFGAGPARVPFRPDEGVSLPDQIAALVAHPSMIPTVFSNTLRSTFVPHFEQFIGVLGWSDTFLPSVCYGLACFAFASAGLIELRRGNPSLGFRWGAVFLASGALTWAAIYATLYLTWTKVGADAVDGIQGRYFVPSAMIFALAVPCLGGLRLRRLIPGPDRVAALAWAGLSAAVALNVLYLPRAVLERFWG